MDQYGNLNMETDAGHHFDEIDLRQLLAVVLKWKWLIILITFLAIIVSGIMSFFVLPPVYEAQTNLLVVQGDDKTTTRYTTDDLEALIGSISRLPEMTIMTYVQQIKNPVLLNDVINKLELAAQGYTIESMAKLIEANSIKDTNLIEVRVQNTDPQLAKSIAATLTDLLLESISKSSQEQMSKSVSFLQEQADSVKKELETERSKLKELDSRPRSVLYLEQERTTSLNELSRYKSMYQETAIAHEQTKAALEQLKQTLSQTNEMLRDQPNPVYLNLKQQILEKEIDLLEKQVQMSSISGYIAQLEKQISSLQVEITNKNDESQVIQRRVDELEKTYNLLAEKITQTQITKSVNLGETSLQVVSAAIVKENPVKPNKKLNLAIAGVLGLFISLGAAFVLNLFDNKLSTKEDIEKFLQIPVLGEIPTFSENGNSQRTYGKGI